MGIIIAIIMQICYFAFLLLIIKFRKNINKSPYMVFLWGLFVLGFGINSLSVYDIYQYFANGKEDGFFLGGALMNIVIIQIAMVNPKKD